jgi:hypothetical protein
VQRFRHAVRQSRLNRAAFLRRSVAAAAAAIGLAIATTLGGAPLPAGGGSAGAIAAPAATEDVAAELPGIWAPVLPSGAQAPLTAGLFVQLRPDGTFVAFDGCNDLRGRWVLYGHRYSARVTASGDRLCIYAVGLTLTNATDEPVAVHDNRLQMGLDGRAGAYLRVQAL